MTRIKVVAGDSDEERKSLPGRVIEICVCDGNPGFEFGFTKKYENIGHKSVYLHLSILILISLN